MMLVHSEETWCEEPKDRHTSLRLKLLHNVRVKFNLFYDLSNGPLSARASSFSFSVSYFSFKLQTAPVKPQVWFEVSTERIFGNLLCL